MTIDMDSGFKTKWPLLFDSDAYIMYLLYFLLRIRWKFTIGNATTPSTTIVQLNRRDSLSIATNLAGRYVFHRNERLGLQHPDVDLSLKKEEDI